jgi:hypothetical protein
MCCKKEGYSFTKMNDEEIKVLLRDVYDYISDKENYEKEMWKEAYYYLYSYSKNSLEEISKFKESRVYRFYMSKISGESFHKEEKIEEVEEVEEKVENVKEKTYIFLEGNLVEVSIDQDLVKEVEFMVDEIISNNNYQEYLKGMF